jgi:hypothetical protein
MSYLDVDAISQTYLKRVLYGHSEKKESSGMTMGSMIDMLVTQEDKFRDTYFVLSNEEMPSDTIKAIIDLAFTYEDRSYERAIEELNYIGNRAWSMEKKVEKVTSHTNYINQKIASVGKTIISHEQYTQANLLALKVMQQLNELKLQGDRYNQLELYQDVRHNNKDFFCKGMLDIVFIGDTIQPIDIKYTSHNFEKSAKMFRYDIQAAFYTKLLQLEYPNIPIEPFMFIVVGETQADTYVLSEEDLYIGEWGAKAIYNTVYTPHNEWKAEYDIYGYRDAFDKLMNPEEEGVKLLKLWT